MGSPITEAMLAKRALLTGASGLLGRQVHRLLEQQGWQVRGLCSSRCYGGLVKCDLTQEGEAEKQVQEFRPDIVVHMAAERRPDVVHKATLTAQAMNVDATRWLAQACSQAGAWMIYISTDYVFDGCLPPYSVNATPKPLSEYGMQKWEGERVTLEKAPKSAILRIPLIYGQMEYFKESGVTALYEQLREGRMAKADDSQRRYPTYTQDVARIIEKMIAAHASGSLLQGIFHWQTDECLTKYDMVHVIADLTRLDASAVLSDKSPPKFPVPQDTRLDCSRLIQVLDIDPADFRTPFREALRTSFLQYSIVASGTAKAYVGQPTEIDADRIITKKSKTAQVVADCTMQAHLRSNSKDVCATTVLA